VKNGAVEDEGVELAVFAAGVNQRRQVTEKRCIEFPSGEAAVKDLAVHAHGDGAKARGVQVADELARIAFPDGEDRGHAHAGEVFLAIGAQILEEDVAEGDAANAAREVNAQGLVHSRFIDPITALRRNADFVERQADRLRLALQEFAAAVQAQSRLTGVHVFGPPIAGWLAATQARLGLPGEARAALAALDDERASSGEIRNARAVICLAEGDPAGALSAVRDVLDGTAHVLGYVTVIEADLLAGLAHRELGDQRAANQAAERALALAESDRLVLPFAMTGSRELLEALPRHQTAHGALLADILDVLHGSSPAATEQSSSPPVEELSPGELRVLRYLPTNLSRPEIAGQLSVSPNTVSAHLRNIYAKLGVRDRSSAVRRARELRLLAAAGRTP